MQRALPSPLVGTLIYLEEVNAGYYPHLGELLQIFLFRVNAGGIM